MRPARLPRSWRARREAARQPTLRTPPSDLGSHATPTRRPRADTFSDSDDAAVAVAAGLAGSPRPRKRRRAGTRQLVPGTAAIPGLHVGACDQGEVTIPTPPHPAAAHHGHGHAYDDALPVAMPSRETRLATAADFRACASAISAGGNGGSDALRLSRVPNHLYDSASASASASAGTARSSSGSGSGSGTNTSGGHDNIGAASLSGYSSGDSTDDDYAFDDADDDFASLSGGRASARSPLGLSPRASRSPSSVLAHDDGTPPHRRDAAAALSAAAEAAATWHDAVDHDGSHVEGMDDSAAREHRSKALVIEAAARAHLAMQTGAYMNLLQQLLVASLSPSGIPVAAPVVQLTPHTLRGLQSYGIVALPLPQRLVGGRSVVTIAPTLVPLLHALSLDATTRADAALAAEMARCARTLDLISPVSQAMHALADANARAALSAHATVTATVTATAAATAAAAVAATAAATADGVATIPGAGVGAGVHVPAAGPAALPPLVATRAPRAAPVSTPGGGGAVDEEVEVHDLA